MKNHPPTRPRIHLRRFNYGCDGHGNLLVNVSRARVSKTWLRLNPAAPRHTAPAGPYSGTGGNFLTRPRQKTFSFASHRRAHAPRHIHYNASAFLRGRRKLKFPNGIYANIRRRRRRMCDVFRCLAIKTDAEFSSFCHSGCDAFRQMIYARTRGTSRFTPSPMISIQCEYLFSIFTL